MLFQKKTGYFILLSFFLFCFESPSLFFLPISQSAYAATGKKRTVSTRSKKAVRLQPKKKRILSKKNKSKPEKTRKVKKQKVKMSSRLVAREVRPSAFPGSQRLKTVQVLAEPVPFFVSSGGEKNVAKKRSQTGTQVFSFRDPREVLDNRQQGFATPFGQVIWPEIANRLFLHDGKFYVNYKGYRLELTLDPKLQEVSERTLFLSGAKEGATVVLSPSTGAILAIAQGRDRASSSFAVDARAPAASLLKIVTAAAAIEKSGLSPFDEISFRGGCGSDFKNGNWIVNQGADNRKLTLAKAFGSSCNPVFGRLALYDIGISSFMTYGERFLFNRPIPSDVRIQTSLLLLPSAEFATSLDISAAGSGYYGGTSLSPVHAALLSAAISNDGVMMAPYLVRAAYDAEGREVYRARPVEIARVISKETARKMEPLLLATVSAGTSRRAFQKVGTRQNIDEIGGKTGTLSGAEERDVLYNWFSGVAPLGSPKSIAIATCTASPLNFVVRASAVAQPILSDYLLHAFKNEARLTNKK